MSAPPGFNGLWRYDWDSPQFDQRAADAMGCLSPHGTYTRVQYFRVHMSDKNRLTNGVLDVFNENGDFGRFSWNGTDAWQADPTPVTFTATAGKFVTKDAPITLTPNLALDRYDTTNFPSNARPGKGYVKRVTTPMPAAQRIVPDPSGKWFTWYLAKGDFGLDFTSCFQQLSASTSNSNKSFGDTFLGQSKLAQLGFPYYGFNPSNMGLYPQVATKSTVTSAVALTGNAANLVDGTIIKSGDVLTIASTGGGKATNITFGASESLLQLNAALAANNLTASLDSSNKLVITTTTASSTIGVVTYHGTGTLTFGAVAAPVAPQDQSGASQPYELSVTGSGTPSAGVIPTNPRQTFNGTLVFAFPTDNSKDYVRAEDLPDQPFLPLGLGAVPIESKVESTHTEMVSSLEDRMRSWSVTLGLSANLAKVVDLSASGSFGNKIEEQNKSESRYTVSRRITKSWAIRADIPSHRLHENFIDHVQSATAAVLSGSQPRWDSFVTSFGTHYAHAITQGAIDYAETRFDLKAETTAYANNMDLKASASVVIDAVRVGGKGEWDQAWSNKTGLDISNEDVTHFSIAAVDAAGHPMPMGIFFDLRPLDELFSPVFFPYNPADTGGWGQLAPFVWHEVRHSFAAYLQKQAQDTAVGIDFSKNYTPCKFRVGFDNLWIPSPNPGSLHKWYGTIKLQGVDGNGIEMHDLDIPKSQAVWTDYFPPQISDLWCYLAGRASHVPGETVQFTCDIDLHVIDLQGNATADPKATNLLVAIPLDGNGILPVEFTPNGYTVFCRAVMGYIGLLQR